MKHQTAQESERSNPIIDKGWLIAFIALALGLLLVLRMLLFSPPHDGSLLYSLTHDFIGNIVSGIVVSFLFLFLSLQFSADAGKKLKRISKIIEDEEARFKRQREIEAFDEFMHRENYHDICLPKLATTGEPGGLRYTIEPQRSANGTPLRYESEMESLYVVRVRGPAHENVLSAERLAEYESSPIKDGEYYFCRFYDAWYLGQETFPGNGQPFYLSGKVGPVSQTVTANQFMGLMSDPKDKTLVTTIMITQDGREYTVSDGGATPYKVYRDDRNGLFLKIHDSPLKPMYLFRAQNAKDDSDLVFVIEGMRGYFENGETLSRLRDTIQNKLNQLNVPIPTAKWYHFDR